VIGCLSLLTVACVGGLGVVLLAGLLRASPRVRCWPVGCQLAAAHSLVVLGILIFAPLYVVATWDSPYGDVYVPYLLAPGFHIIYPVDRVFGEPVFHWLLKYLESFPASILSVIVVPGLVGLVVGGAQWWLLGTMWHYLFGSRNVV
jgi:hypothetical protein